MRAAADFQNARVVTDGLRLLQPAADFRGSFLHCGNILRFVSAKL